MAKGPLDGVRVLDLTEFIFGPYATQVLGDLGADVVKVENPGGDRQRHGSKHAANADMGATFMTLNRNKRSITLDLKTDEDRAKLRALVPTAQVFIHNVRADAMAKLGFSYDEVAKLNPHIVYVHCVGYGSDGPYAGRQAFDDLVQAASGAADLLPRVDGNEDMRLLPSYVADKVSSMHALWATLAALYHQKATGEGQFVEVPMFESFTSFMMAEHLYGETFVPPVSHVGHTPALANDRRPLKCKDGHISIQPVSRAACASGFTSSKHAATPSSPTAEGAASTSPAATGSPDSSRCRPWAWSSSARWTTASVARRRQTIPRTAVTATTS